MGLFDGYVDPEQFRDSGGLLGRLLSLQPQQGQFQPGAGFDQPQFAPQTPVPVPPPWPNMQAYGQTPSAPPPPAPDLHSQYQALRPILGDRNAMLATVHPEAGQTLIAQALAGSQRDNTAKVVQAGYRLGGIPFPPMAPVPPPPIPVPAIPDWWKAAGPILRRVFSGVAGGGGDGEYDCEKERKKALEICSQLYDKSVYDTGPYRNPSGRPWNLQDCMRGFMSERCGGNATDK
jgi:hypothetical protein